jgi:hypothetical protein
MFLIPKNNGTIGTKQGLYPVGSHVPTEKEWITLIDYLGGSEVLVRN